MTDILPMFIRNIAIITAGIFHEELSVLTGEDLLFTFNGMLLIYKHRAKFCCSVGPVFWCLVIGPPSNSPVRHDRRICLTVFQEVDRSVKQIKFHLKSYLMPDRKMGINSNNLPKS